MSEGTIILPSGSGGGGGATIPSTTNLIAGDGAGNGADSGIAPTTTGTGAIVLATSPTFVTSVSLGTGYLSTTKTAGASGTTANLLCKIDNTGNVVTAATSDVGILGIAASTATTGNPVQVATRGIINGVADNTTVIGNVLIVGTGTAGRVRDSGTTDSTSIPLATQVVGKALTVATVGNPVSIQLYGPGHYGAQAGTGSGSVTSVSVVTANGLSGTVATATTTPAITLAVGAINLASATALPLTTGVTGTLPVANGGTGVTTLTAFAPVFGGTTSTAPVQSGTAGTSGQVLTSNGAGVLPTFQAAGGGGAAVANPGAQLLGLTAINGSAATALRSDGAPALSQAIVPTWTGVHTFQNAAFGTSGVAVFVNSASGGSTFYGGITVLATNLSAGDGVYSSLGANTNNNNRFFQVFHYTGDGSASNYYQFIAAGGTNSAAFFPSGGLYLGTTPADPGTANIRATDLKCRSLVPDFTNTAGGTTGAQTINKSAGTVNFAAGATTLVVTDSLVTATSTVFAVVRTNDTTATIKNVVPAAGSFTITLTAAATAETSVGFFVIN